MNLEALANVGEFLSAIVVVISLVYLAYQVRQNTNSLRTENYARALERISSMQGRMSADSQAARGPALAGVPDDGRRTARRSLIVSR